LIDGFTASDLPRLLRTVCAAAVGGTDAEWVSLDDLTGWT
jgi:hypothetical protein